MDFELLRILRSLFAQARRDDHAVTLHSFSASLAEILAAAPDLDHEEVATELEWMRRRKLVWKARDSERWRIDIYGFCEGIGLRDLTDFLRSFCNATEDTEISISRGSRAAITGGGFTLTRWIKAPLHVLPELLEIQRRSAIELFKTATEDLRIFWNIEVHLPDARRPTTVTVIDSALGADELFLRITNMDEFLVALGG